MIKFITIVVLLATGLQCRVMPDEDSAPISPGEKTIDKSDISPENRTIEKSDASPEARKVDKSDERASNAASSNSAQEISKEASIEDANKSDKSEATEERSAIGSGSSERRERSTEGSRKEGKKHGTRSTNIDEEKAAPRRSSSEKSKESERSGAECVGTCTSNSRNSKGNTNDATQARSENDSSESKSDTITTETSERDDASHINIKESRRAPEVDKKETPNQRSAGEQQSKTGSVDNKNPKTVPVEPKSASQESQSKTANQDNTRNSKDAEDDAKSALLSDVGVEALVKSDIEDIPEISPDVSLRIFHQKPQPQDGTPKSSEMPADLRMAPREDATPSGLQVNSFGLDDSGQSEYPYTPLGSSNPDTSPMLPSLPNPLSRTLPARIPFTQPHNFNPNFPLPSPIDVNKQMKMLPPLPPLEKNEGFKVLPPLPPLEPFKPLPPLRPMELMKPFQLLPPLRPIEGNGQFEPQQFLPPLQPFTSFKPLPPIRPLQKNRLFEPLPPLPPLEPFRPFTSLPPLRPLDHGEQIQPMLPQNQNNMVKLLQQLQLLQHQQPSRNLFLTFPTQPINSKIPLPTFKPSSPTKFSLLRQAGPEQPSDGLPRIFHAALTTPNAVMSYSRTVQF